MTVIPESGAGASATEVLSAAETERARVSGFKQHQLGFHASRSTLLGMSLKFMLLKILTLGIYRFWEKTHLRNYLWSSVELEGDRFEYHGTAKELFIGFLVVLAILVPILALSGWISGQLTLANPTAGAFFQSIYTLAVLALIQLAIYRMWRYRLTRTSWRGIRFHMGGSSWKYAGIAFLWTFLTFLTLGLIYPWARVALVKYRVENAYFGNRRFTFSARGGKLFLRFLGMCILLIAVFGILLAVAFPAFLALESGVQDMSGLWSMFIAIPVFYLIFPVFYLWYKVWEFRYFTDCTEVGGFSFTSRLRTAPLLGAALLSGLANVVVLTLFVGLIVAASAGLGDSLVLEDQQTITELDILLMILSSLNGIAVVLLSVAMLMIVAVINRVIFGFAVLKGAAGTMSVGGSASLETIQQSQERKPTHGEGLADALDVGAF